MTDIFAHVDWRCTVCDKQHCFCWERCSCGWSNRRGTFCCNPATIRCSSKVNYGRYNRHTRRYEPKEEKPAMFKIGDQVKWASQANASWKRKQGEVVAVVPVGVTLDEILQQHDELAAYNTAALDGSLSYNSRDHESYLVLVRPDYGNAKPKLYWPRVNNLRVCTEKEPA